MTTDATGKTEKEKMLAGELYRASDEYLAAQHVRARVMCRRFNDAPEEDIEGRGHYQPRRGSRRQCRRGFGGGRH